MPGWLSLVRLLRRRLVLGLIFALSLTYCALSLFHHERKGIFIESNGDDSIINDDMNGDDDVFQSSGKPFLWQMQIINDESNDNSLDMATLLNSNGSEIFTGTCRNSVQGKALIVDERGLVCARQEVLPSGCCSSEQEQNSLDGEPRPTIKRERYSCESCNAQGCCAVYEYCVSCCLQPGKIKGRRDREADPEHTRTNNKKNRRVEDTIKHRLRNLDRFQVCLATCRTSSASVRHENTYKDPHSKHCYNLQSSGTGYHQRNRRDLIIMNNKDDNPDVAVTSSSTVSLLKPFCQNPRPEIPTFLYQRYILFESKNTTKR
ncbi:UPF0454 protein C12orf49 homolog [Cephus cinctus]|uniref:SREBP regulating gene protein n=1 Tax=Cephus cinctus TaxID=211228 RepID=A0AAJ7BYF2_CEPCN|nr:UPF0454 protein C12orf49 homolog [Cephus cinctus]